MAMHLKNLMKILTYTLEETSTGNVIDILYKKTKLMIEQYIILRDAENFIAYFKLQPNHAHAPKPLKFESELVQDFINHTYVECDREIRHFRAKSLYSFLENKLNKFIGFDNATLTSTEKKLKKEKQPSLARVMERACIAIVLKWLQGPLQKKLSEHLHNYITFLATIYGMYGTNRVFIVNWQPYNISKEDSAIINSEYRFFETAIVEAKRRIKEAIAKRQYSEKYQDQFRVVFSSIDNLIKMSESARLDSLAAFEDKVIVAATLIYMQDEFVVKDPELKKLIDLLVSFYYQFRDKRYISVFTDSTSIKGFL